MVRHEGKQADIYDKYNDNSFFNNMNSVQRDQDNSDYFDFLAFVGHQFDLVTYVEGISDIETS